MTHVAALPSLRDADFVTATGPGSGLVAVEFTAAWCGPCRTMAPVLDAVAGALPRIRFVQIDADANPATTARLGVRGLPTTLLLRDGEVVERVVGVVPASVFRERLARHLR
jgi:thioredoxin 1